MSIWTHNDIAKVDLTWTAAGIGMSCCIFQCRLAQGSPHPETEINVMADLCDWMDAILAPIRPHIVVNYIMQGSSVYKRVGLLWNFEGQILPDGSGGSIGDPLPSGVAALVTVSTDVSRVMAKKYWPGFSETGQTAGLWVAGVLTAMANSGLAWAWGYICTHCTDTSLFPGVWSLKTGGFKLLTGAAEVSDVPAYQRRRKAGVGV